MNETKSASAGEERQARLELMKSLLPEGAVQTLSDSNDCQLCAGKPRTKTGYALTDYGHIDPKDGGTLAGQIAVGRKVGTILPLEIACCEQCKKNYRTLRLVPMLFLMAGLALGLILMAVPSLRYAALRIHFSMPLLVFGLCALLGWGAGKLWKKSFLKKKGRETRFDLHDVPAVAQMEEKGWFPLEGTGKEPKLVFSKEKSRRSWYC